MSGLLNIETALGSLGQANASAPVTLGPLILQGVEVPNVLSVGGEQALTVHRLVGGDRVIQPMGPDPAPITLTGRFIGPGALARALQLTKLRDAGQPLRLGFAGVSLMVVIRPASYDYQLQGAVIPFQVTVEVLPTVAVATSTSPSALSALVGPDIASAVTAVSTTLAGASALAATAAGQAQAIVGQVAPLASLVGAGGLLAGVEDKLTVAGTLASAGTNFGAAPAAAASMVSGLQSAGSDLMTTIGQAGANLEGISAAAPAGSLFSDTASLQAAMANAGVLAGAVQTGAFVNRSLTNTQLAAGITLSGPIVHS